MRVRPVVAEFAAVADKRETRFATDGWMARFHTGKEDIGMHQAHISALQTKHAGLDQQITQESQRPQPDMAMIVRLKKEKLRIKEELAGF